MNVEEAIRKKAQYDWTNRAKEPHNANIIAGIQIGYDRAIAALTKHLEAKGETV